MIRLYDFECVECSKIFESLQVDNEPVQCPNCYSDTRKLPPIVNVNMGVGAYGYYDETLGKYIGTNKERKEEMRKQGVTEKGGTPKPDGGAWV